MESARSKLGLGAAIGAVGVLALLGLAGLAVVYTGAYNVAATEEHLSLTRWAFDTTMHRSVRSRADAITRAAEDATPAMLESGASLYKSTCQHCHGGPGVEREEWAGGMRPRPPHLAEAAAEWEPNELFWIAKHGIRMTGMPAFGPSHDDETLWKVVAFVAQLPAMTPERYASLGGGAGHGHGGGAHGSPGGMATPAPAPEAASQAGSPAR
ncbi:cytochrome c [Ramlibacter sp. AW1]|uniref:Cytochrome c n=1 Tax=Ramlibacter aurantiacus TaxID=2801330 RepID=A0A936ZEA7_9BURK|nr:cytochrome c [Ramlibacter aurantiacus]MBL0419979.1 cytochrome c [Ramlibacter aurantiacus]